MSRNRFQLAKGTRYLTEAELDARRAERALEKGEQKVTRDGWAVKLPKVRRGRRRRRIPRGIWGMPR